MTQKEIGESSFEKCESLVTVDLSLASLTKIEEYTFNECTRLAQITIPSSVTGICSSSFSFCFSLTQITFGSSVTKIGESAFTGCISLVKVIIQSPITDFAGYTKIHSSGIEGTFKGCSSLK